MHACQAVDQYRETPSMFHQLDLPGTVLCSPSQTAKVL